MLSQISPESEESSAPVEAVPRLTQIIEIPRVSLIADFSLPGTELADLREPDPCHASVEWDHPGFGRPHSSRWWREQHCGMVRELGYYLPAGYRSYSMNPWGGAQDEWDSLWDLDDRPGR